MFSPESVPERSAKHSTNRKNPMKLEIQMVTEVGDFLADGHLGNRFRSIQIESVWQQLDTVTFDFSGVTNLTDSFVHACFGNMAEEHGQEFLSKVRFRGCSPLVRSFLSIAIAEGMRNHRKFHAGH